jgi:hypothetical protein
MKGLQEAVGEAERKRFHPDAGIAHLANNRDCIQTAGLLQYNRVELGWSCISRIPENF